MKKLNYLAILTLCIMTLLSGCGNSPADSDKVRENRNGEKVEQNSEPDKSLEEKDAEEQKENADQQELSKSDEGNKEDSGNSAQSAQTEGLRENQRKYVGGEGYAIVTFENGDYYEFEDYDESGELFWHCDWSFEKLEGDACYKEICTGENAQGTRVYQTIYATHELFYPMEYYENGLGVEASYIYLNVAEDKFTVINVDRYSSDDFYYRIHPIEYTRVY